MEDQENELAFRLFTVETGNASRIYWNVYRNKDKYQRMARVAINYLAHDEGTRTAHESILFTNGTST